MDLKHIKSFIVEDGHLSIESFSGSNYIITKTTCSCKGFGFRRTCSHFKEATENGLITLLQQQQSTIKLTLSPTAIKMRKDALKKLLTKHNITFTENMINTIEPQLTISTKPEDVIALAKICKVFAN